MKTNEILREQIFETVENQIKSNNPQETNLTFRRLINLGYTLMSIENNQNKILKHSVLLNILTALA